MLRLCSQNSDQYSFAAAQKAAMKTMLRRKLLIDPKVQGMLISRVILYWAIFVSGMFCLLAGFPLLVSLFIHSPGEPTAGQVFLQTWRTFWPALFASCLMLPLLLLDIIRVTHRFAGPIYRLRSALHDLADGKPVEPIVFRYGDFWCAIADEFNRATARIRELQPAGSPEHRGPESANVHGKDRSIAL